MCQIRSINPNRQFTFTHTNKNIYLNTQGNLKTIYLHIDDIRPSVSKMMKDVQMLLTSTSSSQTNKNQTATRKFFVMPPHVQLGICWIISLKTYLNKVQSFTSKISHKVKILCDLEITKNLNESVSCF